MSNNSEPYLVPLLTDTKHLGREAVRRRKVFDEKSISAEVIPEHEANGWQLDRKRKRKTTVRQKNFRVRLAILQFSDRMVLGNNRC